MPDKKETRIRTKRDLIGFVSNDSTLTFDQSKEAVDAVLKFFSRAMVDGDDIQIRKFLTLKQVVRKQKVGQNMNTGQPVVIPEKRAIKMIVSDEILNEMNNPKKDWNSQF